MRSLSLFIIILISTALHAQDVGFTQFYANPMNTNPAMAGTATKLESAAGRAIVNYNNSSPGLPGAYRIFTGSWDQEFDKLHGGLGAQFYTASQYRGAITNSEIRGFYSLRSEIGKNGKNLLYSGIQLSYYNRSINWGGYIFGDDIIHVDTVQPKSSVNFFNPAIGFLWSNPKYYIGIAVHNILEPNQSFFYNPNHVLPRKYTVHAGYIFQPSAAHWSLQPQGIYTTQRNFTQFSLGSLYSYKVVQAGIWYRQTFGQYKNSDALIFNLGFQNAHFRALYSYDFTVSDGRSAVPSTHEISICYRWKTKQTKAANSNIIY